MDAGVKAKKSGGSVERSRKGTESGAISTIKAVGIIGAGQMGNGIAHVVSLAGYDVAMFDVKKEAVDKARSTIERNMTRQVSRGIITDAQMGQALKRIGAASDMSSLGEADLVIEAATEDEAVKRKIFTDLCPRLKKDAIREQYLVDSITRLASVTDRPGALHRHALHEPADDAAGRADPRHRYRGRHLATARNFIQSLGKNIAVSEDFPAFIVNRILLPMINEAVYTLYEGVGTVESIDKAMRLGANHPMGPLELADFIGLDTCLSVMQVLYEGLADSKYRPCPLLVKYVEAGWLGRKTQRGFYDYRGEKPVPTR
jgi:3-hydroxybutyryl-CoA dehydrogenase